MMLKMYEDILKEYCTFVEIRFTSFQLIVYLLRVDIAIVISLYFAPRLSYIHDQSIE